MRNDQTFIRVRVITFIEVIIADMGNLDQINLIFMWLHESLT